MRVSESERAPPSHVLYAYVSGAVRHLPSTLLTQWLPPVTIQALALRRLRAIVEHASRDVPMYREHLSSVPSKEITTPEAVARIPFLTKTLVRQHSDRMLADSAPPKEFLFERGSSGSSGMPLRFYFDPIRDLPRRIQELRFLTAYGMKPWHMQLMLDHPQNLPKKKFFIQHLKIWRREQLAPAMSAADVVQAVARMRPHIVNGVLSSLRLLALATKETGGLGYKPLFVVSKGERLDPASRALIEEALSAPLYDYYAMEEVGIIAWQCPSGDGYHIDEDFTWVETVREDGTPTAEGELGEIVVTNLYLKTMPFIRYRTGDLGIISREPCSCGRGLPRLKSIHGRQLDLIVTPDGVAHDPFSLLDVMEDVPEVFRYRIQQVALDELRVEVNLNLGISEEDRGHTLQRISRGLGNLLGNTMRIGVAEVLPFVQPFGKKWPLVRGFADASIASRLHSTARPRLSDD